MQEVQITKDILAICLKCNKSFKGQRGLKTHQGKVPDCQIKKNYHSKYDKEYFKENQQRYRDRQKTKVMQEINKEIQQAINLPQPVSEIIEQHIEQETQNEIKECIICYKELDDTKKISLCGDSRHELCTVCWYQFENPNCPICRKTDKMLTSEMYELMTLNLGWICNPIHDKVDEIMFSRNKELRIQLDEECKKIGFDQNVFGLQKLLGMALKMQQSKKICYPLLENIYKEFDEGISKYYMPLQMFLARSGYPIVGC